MRTPVVLSSIDAWGGIAAALVLGSAGLLSAAAPYTNTQAPGRISATGATLHAMVTPNGEPTIAWFEWGTNTNYGWVTAPIEVGAGSKVVRVNAEITGSLFGELVHYRVVSSNASGIAYGHDQVFVGGGRLIWWGTPTRADQTNMPAVMENVLGTGLGGFFGLALRIDGSVSGWGRPSHTNVPPDVMPAVAVTANFSFGLGLREDGRVFSWPTSGGMPPGLDRVVALAAGSSHFLALRDDGTVVGWSSDYGAAANVPAGLSNVVAIAAGNAHSLALRDDGSVVAWGSNGNGESSVPEDLGRVVAIAGGMSHSLTVRANGTVAGWGNDSHGELQVPAELANAVAVAAGQNFSLALTSDGSVVAWGSNASGQTTVPEGLERVASFVSRGTLVFAVRAPVTEEVTPFAATQAPGPVTANSAALNAMATPRGTDATAWFEWGPRGNLVNRTAQAAIGSGVDVVRLSASVESLESSAIYDYRLVVSNRFGATQGVIRRFSTGGRVSSWGSGWYGGVLPPAELGNVVAVAAGDYHGLAIRNDGSLAMWGHHYPSLIPVGPAPLDLGPVVAVAGGRGHTLAVTLTGQVRAWGDNSYGQTDVPTGLADVIAVSAGDRHSLALCSDGSVTAWGGLSTVPIGLRNVVAISSGDLHNFALIHDGTVVSWGDNFDSPSDPPPGIDKVAVIAAGFRHNAVLDTDGKVTVWTRWGDDTLTTVPADLGRVLSIAAGDHHTLALRDDGTINAWGYSNYGSIFIPAGLQNVVEIATGDQFCMALGENTPPQASARTMSVAVDDGSGIVPPFFDPNGDPLQIRVAALPTVGTLHQYTGGGPGDLINTVGQAASEAEGRLFFKPRPQEMGKDYDHFSLLANDGEYNSTEAGITINVVPVPTIEPGSVTMPPGGAIAFTFAGLPDVTYSIQKSSDLRSWGDYAKAQSTPGGFTFEYRPAESERQLFFRIRVP